ncbi:helix-turn-helix domain-containing protein [Mucilaginibacter angelicae]|uniref:Helix-turn-helix domain-containing protein n=1 Tax=Mucilaginibacter angelicae TaxID=869718 RepID=A0ABV6L7T8_9SPHI
MNLQITETRPEKDKVLARYLQAFTKFSGDGVIDLDKRLKYKFEYLLHDLGRVVRIFNGTVPPSRQSIYTIALIKEGSGLKNIGQHAFPILNNTLFIIPARVIQSSRYDTLACIGFLLHFDLDFFSKTVFPKESIINRKIFRTISKPYLYLNKSQAKSVSRIFEQMMNEADEIKNEDKDMLAVKILELLIHCDRLFSKTSFIGNEIGYHPVIHRFSELLEYNYKTHRSVQFYAKTLNVHPNHLNFLLKKHNGLNAKQYINNKIISECKYLLSNSSFIIKEIANHMGFDDPNNFSTFFQKCTGQTPLSYRESCPLYRPQSVRLSEVLKVPL